MKIHREGKTTLFISAFLFLLLSSLLFIFASQFWWINGIWLLLFGFLLNFFRNPDRTIKVQDENLFYSPADGKVVVIEEAKETEFFEDQRLLISIFMSPLDVHVNRIPVSGKITYSKHQPGKYLPAFNPKSSDLNERHTTVIDSQNGLVMIRQIAGIMARRICNYCSIGQQVGQGEEMGFIKFGSRADIFLPLGTEVKVEIGQQVKSNIDVLARLR